MARGARGRLLSRHAGAAFTWTRSTAGLFARLAVAAAALALVLVALPAALALESRRTTRP